MIRVVAIFALSTLVLAAQDRIDLSEGAPILDVKIDQETFKRVTYEKADGKKGSVDGAKVVSVTRGATPNALREGRALYLTGDYANAIRLLETAERGADAADWVKEYAAFWRGRALLASGEGLKAVSAFEKVLSINGESRLLPETRIGIGNAHAVDGDHGKAKSTLEAFEKEVADKKLPARWAAEAKRSVGKSLERRGDWSEAARTYGSLISSSKSMAGSADAAQQLALKRVALLAELDRGNALVRAGRPNDAQSAFAGIRGKYQGVPGANAVAMIGEAQVQIAKGDADGARIKLTEVLALHFEEPAVRPNAMLLLAEAYRELAKKGESEARIKAQTYLKTVSSRFPGTEAARQAREMMNKL